MTSVHVENGRIHVLTSIANNAICKAINGYRWAPQTKTWHYPATPASARAIELGFRGERELRTDEHFGRLLEQARAQERAREIDPHEVLDDLPTTTEAWSHQRQAFWRVIRGEHDSFLLAMDMGTGKSLTAIGLLDHWQASRVLILAPKNACRVWPSQFQQHSSRGWDVIFPPERGTVIKRAHYAAQRLANARGPAVLILNYEAAWRPGMEKLLLALEWDAVVLDESHRIKAAGGKASLFCARLRDRTRRRLCLTGTPMPHSPLDLYGQFRFLDPGIFGVSVNRFKNRYAIMGGFENRQVVAWQNEAELADKFGSISYTVRADDVLDLPPYHHVERYCELEPAARRIYTELDKEFVAGVGDGTVTTTNALTKLLRLQQVTSGHIKDDDGLVQVVSTAKAELLRDVLEDFPAHEPVVIFCRFHHDLDVVREVCGMLGRKAGELSARRRDLTDDAKMPGDLDVLAVQIQSGGVGIDLTRAAYAIYYSLGYSLGDYEQSLKRVHRPGQARATTYIHLIAEKTKDVEVYKALRARKNVVDALVEAAKNPPLLGG
jgi:SNF2 family DNA or RNA helicase